MFPNVVSVECVGGYRVRLRFDDGVEGEVDLSTAISFDGVFAELEDPDYFARVRVVSESGTIGWPNGADLDPLVLQSRITGRSIDLDSRSRQAG